MTEVKWYHRYRGSPWHRIKLLIRGVFGYLVLIPALLVVLLLVILEGGNRVVDEMGDSGEKSESNN